MQLAEQIRGRAGMARIGFESGPFDRLHAGHTRLLAAAAAAADYLVVGIVADGASLRPDWRLETVRALGVVHEAHVLPCAPAAFIAALRPAVVLKGREHAGRDNAEAAVQQGHGGVLLFSPEPAEHAPFTKTDQNSIRLPSQFPERHGFQPRDLRQTLGRFVGLRVLVIGDLILDEYITCQALGMSQEDPTLVVTPLESQTFLGGAGIVAAHARGLGADVRFLTVVGEDDRATYASEALAGYGVAAECFRDPSRPTTLKQRFRAAGKTLLRVNHLRQHEMAPELAARVAAAVALRMPTTDLLLFADFNYGCLPQGLVDACIDSARRHGVMMAADSQASSQLSDISRFKGMDLIVPTEREARLAVRAAGGDLPTLAARLQEAADARNLAITLGGAGMLLRSAVTGQIESLPAFNQAPLDVAGAGDSFFCVAAMALRAGEDLWRSAYLGSVAAACQVARLGNVPLSLDDLHTALDSAEAG